MHGYGVQDYHRSSTSKYSLYLDGESKLSGTGQFEFYCIGSLVIPMVVVDRRDRNIGHPDPDLYH